MGYVQAGSVWCQQALPFLHIAAAPKRSCNDMRTLLKHSLNVQAHHKPAQKCCSALPDFRMAFARTGHPQLILL